MSNFRTTADILDGVLRRCGEITSATGISPRQATALLYLNQIHHNIVMGGCELNIDVDEPWVWARSRHPIILNLNPAITTGTVALTYGSASGTLSTAPQVNGSNVSVQGWHIKPTTGPEIYKIIQHTSGSTSITLDAVFPQATNASLNYYLFQLDYDLISSNIIIDSENNTLDFIESGTTVLSATIAAGTYTPAGLATAVATALNAAGTHGNTYTCTYDSNQRLFTVTSALNGTSTPIFQPQGAGTNSYRSGWSPLGFDFLNQTGSASYTGTYPVSSLVRLTQPARIFYGSALFWGSSQGTVNYMDPVAFDKNYPLVETRAGSPEYFTIIREKNNGTLSVRFNRYPIATTNSQQMRIEFEHIATPKDLQNNTASIPLIPRKFIRILEYGASFYLLKDKSDAKANDYLQIAQQTLASMVKVNRKELEKAGKNFGYVIARPDLMPEKRHYRVNNYGYTAEE